MPNWFVFFVALPIAVLIVGSSLYALFWAFQNGHLEKFEQGAKVIFDNKEPIGKPTDYSLNQKKFPNQGSV